MSKPAATVGGNQMSQQQEQQKEITNGNGDTIVSIFSTPNGYTFNEFTAACKMQQNKPMHSPIRNGDRNGTIRTFNGYENKTQTDKQQLNAYNNDVDDAAANDKGYDTCGMYNLPIPQEQQSSVKMFIDITKALLKLRETRLTTPVNGTSPKKHRYFIQTIGHVQKIWNVFYSDIDNLWDIYCIICQHTYIYNDKVPPKLISACHRKTTNTASEYNIVVHEFADPISILFGIHY